MIIPIFEHKKASTGKLRLIIPEIVFKYDGF